MSRDTKLLFFLWALPLILAVLYAIPPNTAPVNPYLAVGLMCFLSGFLLGTAIFGARMENKKKKEPKGDRT